MRIRVPLVCCVLLLAIAACSRKDPVAADANGVNLPAPVNDTAPKPMGAPPENGSAPATAVPSAAPMAVIPPALQGRWGLTPADCTSRLGDAKGLLLVSATELRFYESKAVPSSAAQTDGDSISGDFQFTGEGQSWTKFETLERQKDKLTRTESNPAASFTYAKC